MSSSTLNSFPKNISHKVCHYRDADDCCLYFSTSLHCFLSQYSSTLKHKYTCTHPSPKQSSIYKLSCNAVLSMSQAQNLSPFFIQNDWTIFCYFHTRNKKWAILTFFPILFFFLFLFFMIRSTSLFLSTIFKTASKNTVKRFELLLSMSDIQQFDEPPCNATHQEISQYVNFETCFSFYCEMEICKT